MALALNYQTKTELAARFRARFRAATREQAAKLAYWLIEQIAAGEFTDAQVRAAFGLTTTQYTAMKSRMQTLHDQYAAIQNAAGE